MTNKSTHNVLLFVLFALISASAYARNLHELQKKADAGDSSSQYELGHFYDSRTTIGARDSVKALYWWTKASDNGNFNAKITLAKLYEHGFLVNKTTRDSIIHVSILKYPIEQDINKAILYYKECAVSDSYPFAQYHLGELFYNGTKVSKDYEQAVKYYKRAANNANLSNNERAIAMNCLSACYRYGRGVSADAATSEYWRTEAAKLGNTDAMDVMSIGVYGTLYNEDGTPFMPSLKIASVYKKADENKPSLRCELLIFQAKDKGVFKLPIEMQDEVLVMDVGNEYYPIEFIGGRNLKLTLKHRNEHE